MGKMKLFFTNSFKGHWPVGAQRFTCLAPDLGAAAAMLQRTMHDHGLKKQYLSAVEGLREVPTDEAKVVDFGDGNY